MTIDLRPSILGHANGASVGPDVRVTFAPRPPRRGLEPREPRRFMLHTLLGNLLIEQSEHFTAVGRVVEANTYVLPGQLVLGGETVNTGGYFASITLPGGRLLFVVEEVA